MRKVAALHAASTSTAGMGATRGSLRLRGATILGTTTSAAEEATKEAAEARFAILVELAAGMRVAHKSHVAESVLRLAASRSNESELDTVRRMVAAMAPGARPVKRGA